MIINDVFPKGFTSCSKNVGIKDDTLDFTVIKSSVRASAAAMFTQNSFCGAPIPVGKENVSDGYLQAFVINSKNANVATGQMGVEHVQEITESIANELMICTNDILPSSTGIIGQPLPIEKILSGIKGIGSKMVEGDLTNSATAIMTTDTFPKFRVCHVGDATLVGIAKGSGMIEPNMATLLGYFMTDAEIEPQLLNKMLSKAVNKSFNMVSVDTDTSTSDTVAIMANGLAGEIDLQEFENKLTDMCIDLAKDIAIDGEGATKLVEVNVYEALDFTHAKKIAKSIVNSPLVKTAIYGEDPNWGRIVAAIGKEKNVSPDQIKISFGDICVYNKGITNEIDTEELINYFRGEDIKINIELGIGKQCATVWGCDLSYDYVKINGTYTT